MTDVLQDSEIQALKVKTQGDKEPINVAHDGKFDSPGREATGKVKNVGHINCRP